MLQSFERGNRIGDHFTANFRVDLERRYGGRVNLVQFTVGPTGTVGAPERSVVEFIRSTYADRPGPDLIVTVAGPAANFARRHRQELFPDTPLILGAVDEQYLSGATLGENDTAVAVRHDFAGVVDDILQVRPQTRQVFMVIGSGVIGEFWRQRIEEQFSRFHDRLTFVWSDDLSLPEILHRCSTLPENSAIFFITLGTDSTGVAYADERVIADLHATANAPLFSAHDAYLGFGTVGGRLMTSNELVKRMTDTAYLVLNGASPRAIKVPTQLAGQPIFDWRELQRWDIPENRLSSGSVVRFRGPSLWSEHSGTVLIAVGALAIQALLIVGMLFERRARRRAEFDSRRNLSLAADTSRRETMSALTSSIAHQISQPLSSMIQNTEALQLMLAAKGATPETIGEILTDIHNEGLLASQIIDRQRAMLRNRQLERKPTDLQFVLDGSLALVAHELRARQVEAIVNIPSKPCVISGDEVLLQQVLVNLVMNAMDAMAETPPDRRRITIGWEIKRSEFKRAEVEVSVRDAGQGLPADLIDRLFTPFVTTKPHGLGIGLAIAWSIVEAHGGSIVARNNPEGGATFTVSLICLCDPEKGRREDHSGSLKRNCEHYPVESHTPTR
jgi:signal transduction histidine kinase